MIIIVFSYYLDSKVEICTIKVFYARKNHIDQENVIKISNLYTIFKWKHFQQSVEELRFVYYIKCHKNQRYYNYKLIKLKIVWPRNI